jgi:hypothetical protein
METHHSFILYFLLAWTFFSTLVSADSGSGDGHLMRRATATTTSPTPTSTCGCSTYGICAYGTPYADVVVLDSTCSSCDASCQNDSNCQFAYFAPSTSDCYLWYSAFNQSQIVDCYNLGSGPYVRVGCVSSSSSSSTTASSTSTASSISASSTSSSSSTAITTSSSSSSTQSSSSSTSSTSSAPSGSYTVRADILVLSTDQTSSYSATSGLNAHGIPYQLVIVPSGGATLPALNSSATYGNFGGIIVLNEPPGITTTQWNAMYSYQTSFGVRMARLNADPDGGADGSDFGKSAL